MSQFTEFHVKLLNKPYEKWGTYYMVDTKAWKETLTDGESQDS
jgi:hypothetical protein